MIDMDPGQVQLIRVSEQCTDLSDPDYSADGIV